MKKPKKTKQKGSLEELFLKQFLPNLGFRGIVSRNKSGKQFGFDIGWDIMSEKVIWHFESKGNHSRKSINIIGEISKKLTESIAGHGTDFHCWCLFLPYIEIDENERQQIRNLEKLYLFPYKIVVWDKNFLKNNSLFLKNILIQPNIERDLKKLIKSSSSEGLFRNRLFKKVIIQRKTLVIKNSFKIYIDSYEKNKYRFRINSNDKTEGSSRQFFLLKKSQIKISKKPILLGIIDKETKVNEKESLSVQDMTNSIQEISDIETQKEELIKILKLAKQKSQTLFDFIKLTIRQSDEFCIFEIDTEESLLIEMPFYSLDSKDFDSSNSEVYNKELSFYCLIDSFLQKIQKINQIIRSKNYLKDKDVILDFLGDIKLRYYFLDKLPKKFENLKKVNFILEKLTEDKQPFTLLHILENSISVKNNTYILSFIYRYYENFTESIVEQRTDRMFQESALRIIKKITDSDEKQIDNVLKFLVKLLKKRKYNIRKPLDRKDNVGQEKSLVGEILSEISKKKDTNEELLALIKNNFDLISDYGRFSDITPASIFNILQRYIIESDDFEKAFKKITQIILNQYLQLDLYKGKDGKNKFKGYEWIGGGISQTGNNFSISDNHFVAYILRPALDGYYQKEPKKAFEFVDFFCIWRNEKDKIILTKEHPDFLLRASINVLLREHENKNPKSEKILIEFLKITNGIPSKVDLIFQEIYKKSIVLSDEQKWKLIKEQLGIEIFNSFPANVFVLKIITDLISNKHTEATEFFFELIKTDELYKRIWCAETMVVGMIEALLKNDQKKGLKGFENYIETNFFKNRLGTFDAYPVSYLLNSILNNSDTYQEGLKLLEDLSKQEKDLTSNQQILICNSLINTRENSDSENIEVLMKIYNDFLWPLLNEKLKKDLKRNYKNKEYGLIYNKFPFPHAREKFIQFAERLAKKKKIKEALSIIEIFVNDPHPFTPNVNDPNDKKGEYDNHKKILEGEETIVIDTVRGWCGWVLLQCSVVKSRPYTEKMINLAKKLIEDKNLYVASYGVNALSGLANNRLTVMPENKNKLFFGKDTKTALNNAKKVEKIAFDFLERVKNLDNKTQNGMAEPLLRLFNPMRALSERDAMILINSLAGMSIKTIAKAAPLFIYFAEFRKNYFKEDWKWKMKDLYDDLEDFKAEPFQEKIKEIIKKNISEINSAFAWQLWKLISESVDDKVEIKDVLKYSRAFSIAYKYLKIISSYYDHLAFNHIYRFIEENLEKKPQNCYKLLIKSLMTERQALRQKIKMEKLGLRDWYPHYKIGDILTSIKNNIGINEALRIIEFLLSYPKEAVAKMANEMPNVIQDLPIKYNKNNRIEKIFNKLIEINPRYYDTKEAWKNRSKNKNS